MAVPTETVMIRGRQHKAEPQLDPLIHPTNRLRVCAALAAAGRVEFSLVQQAVGLSASALSKQVHALTGAGYVTQSRGVADSRRIWLRLTPAGRTAYRSHLAALQALIDASNQAGVGAGSGAEEFESTL
jgi:DNA-binding MarR family transcriptional regulator